MSITPFRFGIDTLDDLIAPSRRDESIDGAALKPSTAAIQGPDGCGKSLLTLHLAASYWCEHGTKTNPPVILYVSTDLSHSQAMAQWKSFGLEYPQRRKLVLDHAYYSTNTSQADRSALIPLLKLNRIDPVDDQDTTATSPTIILEDSTPTNAVWFVDLQASTAGDDWGWINRIVGLLPPRANDSAKHLLIIDAVEGLEMMVGDRDAYGSRRSRRSRVAQLIRNATRKNAHVAFVVEERRNNARLPEQFVADLVIRLRQRKRDEYSLRTIEIEKCRAIAHIRGEHEISIRTGTGAFTGKESHFDNPAIPWIKSDAVNGHLAHVYVTRSLQSRNRVVREDNVDVLSPPPSLHIEKEDIEELFGKQGSQGSLTLLLGDTGTHKGKLARHFLASAVAFKKPTTAGGPPPIDVAQSGYAILLTSRLTDKKLLIDSLRSLWCIEKGNDDEIAKRVFCQRLGDRPLSSAQLGEIILTYIRRARQLVGQDLDEDFHNLRTLDRAMDTEQRRRPANKIRIVIEDWSALLSGHRSLREDRLLLPSIITLLRREGVHSLIVSTQSAQPRALITTAADAIDLRTVDEPQLLTWPVPFFGERRVAIAAVGGAATEAGHSIYELVLDPSDGRLRIDPHFDMYRNIDSANPSRVPLVVRLYVGNHPPNVDREQSPLFIQLANDSLTQVFTSPELSSDVLRFDTSHDYDRSFTFATEITTTRLDHTLVVQLDEFWSTDHFVLADLRRYWQEDVVEASAIDSSKSSVLLDRTLYFRHGFSDFAKPPDKTADSLVPDFAASLWDGSSEKFDKAKHVRPSFVKSAVPITQENNYYTNSRVRRDFFIAWPDSNRHGDADDAVDRIPYLWDFGMLVADRNLWRRYREDRVLNLNGESLQLEKIWDALCLSRNRFETDKLRWEVDWRSHRRKVDWTAFLAACRHIAAKESCATFDFDLSTPESLSCLLLEVWASIQDVISTDGGLQWPLRQRVKDDRRWSLRRLIQSFPHSLYLALSELVSTCGHYRSQRRVMERSHASPNAVASREWYHTASARFKDKLSPDGLTLLQLPGTWSTRGDWYLGVPKGSRSMRLAYLALDALTTRRMNVLRLHDGFGLPVRDVLPDEYIGELPTAIRCYDREKKRDSVVLYGELTQLGVFEENKEHFHWQWRSWITNYRRDSFYFRRWIARMFEDREWLTDDFTVDSKIIERMEEAKKIESELGTGEGRIMKWYGGRTKWHKLLGTDPDKPQANDMAFWNSLDHVIALCRSERGVQQTPRGMVQPT